ncbi:MAG: prepilin-type N-terminal cleavage/methylation domain-containing protein [Planctomycetes bacterium]|nr:prepilin-type N-terminal cleavage/methylation domain-containing protein [Planctomycetota bacterium]
MGRGKKAFSLIELVIVIIILGIIAAIAIPRIGAATTMDHISAVVFPSRQ